MVNELKKLADKLDDLNDEFYLAIHHNDVKEMDKAGRELVLLGKVIKDVAYELKKGVTK